MEDIDFSHNHPDVKKYLLPTLQVMLAAGVSLNSSNFETYLKELRRVVNKSIEIE